MDIDDDNDGLDIVNNSSDRAIEVVNLSPKKPISKAVHRIDPHTGLIVQTFTSSNRAGKEMDVSYHSILNCCRGLTKVIPHFYQKHAYPLDILTLYPLLGYSAFLLEA
jgi:hypothetical protein